MGTAQAQFYAAANVANTTGTYTDLGTTGAAIATANTDDANSAATPIGFPFTYNGTAFTDFVLNTNGFVKLGTVAPAGAQFASGGQSATNGPLDGPETNLLLPLNQDLGPGSAGSTEYRVLTTGAAPNRVCTIQWKNVADKPRTTFGTQYANFSFQAKLYETSNQVDFVYGPATAGVLAADVAKICIVGLKGSAATAVVLGAKPSASAWSGTTFVNGRYSGINAHNLRGTVLPDPGRTYRFALPVANDAGVRAVQTLTQLPIPQGAPHEVRAVVTNTGTAALANLPVTLTVSGANAFTNTQTVATLAVGASATVSFAGFTPTTTGTNTLTVTVPPDGNTTNDSRSVTQVVNTTTYSYADAGASGGFVFGYGPNNPRNVLAARYTTGTALNVTQVRAYVVDGTAAGFTTTVGKTIYGVLMDATGTVLARSVDHVVTAAEINTYVSFPLTTLVALPAGTDMYVGLAQLYDPNQTATYTALGGQADGLGRAGAFYSSSTLAPSAFAPTDIYPAFPYRLMLEAVTQTVLGTRDAALAATVGLYPNPAHGTFTLAVPAGPLGAAAATLHNALGQVVQVRQLALPAAGGTTAFDVRGLAAGVYSLMLQAGDNVVVKRVVVE